MPQHFYQDRPLHNDKQSNNNITLTYATSTLHNALKNYSKSYIWTETQGFGNRNLQDIFLNLYRIYGRISTVQLRHNTAKLTEPVESHLPVAVIFKQIEDCHRFATAGGAPFTPAQILKAAESLILSTR